MMLMVLAVVAGFSIVPHKCVRNISAAVPSAPKAEGVADTMLVAVVVARARSVPVVKAVKLLPSCPEALIAVGALVAAWMPNATAALAVACE